MSTDAAPVESDVVDAKLLRARIGLALRNPFLSAAVMRLPLRAVPGQGWCATMATDGYRIFYNPAWAGSLSQAQLRGVLAHELMHVVLQHVDRRRGRHHARWNIACDFAINLMLDEVGFRLPESGLMSRSYVGLPAEDIYDRMGDNPDEWLGADITNREIFNRNHHDDDHCGLIPEVGLDVLDGNEPYRSGLRRSEDLDLDQRRNLIAELRNEIKQKLQGRASAWFQSECQCAENSAVDWRAVLRRWMYDRIRSDWSLWPPSKRHIHRGLLMPSIGVEAPGHVVFAVDTSGSMSQAELSSAFAEVRRFRETFPCRLSFIQADADVKSIEEFGEMDGLNLPDIVIVRGRGGTDFRPVFDWFAEHAADSRSALIYATDGFGTFPSAPPGWPVVWLRTTTGLEAEGFPFGEVVTVEK
jgi:predicted metal-dependent peptidase